MEFSKSRVPVKPDQGASARDVPQLPSIDQQLAPLRLSTHRAWIVLVLAAVCLAGYFYPEMWKFWGILPYPHFLDAAVITAGAESVRHGFDPMYVNPYDRLQRPMNYPRVWQSLALVLSGDSTEFLGCTFYVTFFLGLLVLLRSFQRVPLPILLLALFSPVVILALERANSDLVVFTLLVLSISVRLRSSILCYLLLIAAALLKLFPIFGGAYILHRIPRSQQIFITGLLTLFIGYELLHLPDLYAIRAGTPESMADYGRTCVLLIAEAKGVTLSGTQWCLYTIALFSPLFFLIRKRGSMKVRPGLAEDLYLAGAGIFICTFWLGANYDYRLIFLLLCIPSLVKRYRSSKANSLAMISITAIIGSLWTTPILGPLASVTNAPVFALLATQFVKWLAYCVLGGIWLQLLRDRILLVFGTRAAAMSPVAA